MPRPHRESTVEYTRYELDNGLDVILAPKETAPVVACSVWVGVGSADETPKQAGLAHVHEHMLFKGTDRRGVGEIAHDIESAGGRINAFTSFDQTCYYVVLSSRFFDDALDILADAIGHSSFDADELERELEVIQEEIKRSEDNPSRVSSRMLFETAFSTHPYRLPVIGTSESVDSFERQDVVDFYRQHYVPDNLSLVVAGDFDIDEAKQRIERHFGDLSGPDYTPVERPAEPEQTDPRTATGRRDIRQQYLRIGFHIPDIRHEDIPAIDLLSIILGYGDASHLRRTIEREEELAHRVFTSAYTPREPGVFVIGADFQIQADRPETKPAAVLERILEETFRFHHHEPTPDDLERARTLVESQEIYGKRTVEGLAMKMGRYLMTAGDPDFETEYYRRLRTVDPDDIRRVARRYLTVDNASLIHLGPDDGPEVEDDALIDAARRARESASEESATARTVDTGADDAVTRLEIDDGPTLVIQRDPSVETFSIRALTLGGTRYERDDIAGLHKLLARVATRSTPSRNALEIAADIESMAASIKGMSGRNSFGLGMTGLSRFFDPCFEIFADCALAADAPATEFERERRIQSERLVARQDKLGAVNFDQFTRAFFQPHPYSLPLLGTEKTLQGLDADTAGRHLRRRQHPGDMIVSVVGDVTVDDVVDRVERHFTTTDDAPAAPEIPDVVERDEPGIVIGDLEKEQAHVIVGFPGPVITDDDKYALDVLYAVLSGQGGRLFYELRDRQSLAYSVFARRLTGLDASTFSIQIATSPEKIERAVDGIRTEIDPLRNGVVDDEDLDRARRYLIGNHDIGLQKNASRAMQFGLNELYGLGYRTALDYGSRIDDVSIDDVQRVIDRWIDPRQMVVSITKPPATKLDAADFDLEPIEISKPGPTR